MTADGEHLSGFFAWGSRERAQQTLELGWSRFEALARRQGWKPKPVPRAPLEFTDKKPVPQGGTKLQVAVRDLPRGKSLHPGRNETERCAHNLNWINLTAAEAAAFVPRGRARMAVPDAVFRKIALKTLKDSVRGQCFDWPKGALRAGKLYVRRIDETGDAATIRITGYAVLSAPGRSFACALHGRIVFNTQAKEFRELEFVAAGQRTGGTRFNFRRGDPGPAPMGVAFVLHARQSSAPVRPR